MAARVLQLILATLFALAAPALAARGEQDVEAGEAPKDLAPQAQVDALLEKMRSDDASTRRIAAVRLKNLSGAEADAVEQASKRPDLTDDQRTALQQALPPLRSRARRDALARETQAYDLRSALESYDKFGRKDPRWDATVKQAFELRATAGTSTARTDDMVAAFKKAIDAGCDDPFVRYSYARTEWLASPSDREAVLERHRGAAIDLGKTQYPAEWKCRAAVRCIEQSGAPDAQLAQVVLATLPAALSETGRHHDDVAALVDTVYAALSPSGDAQALFEQVHAIYAKARPADDPGPHVLKGRRYKDYAWEARGSGFAQTVTPTGWKLFGERLAVAADSLEKAYNADPADVDAPYYMIPVIMGGSGDRDEMELWFDRAMKANPDSINTCRSKLRFLFPRWHGSVADMVGFGRECLQTQNWWGPLPTILVEAHEEAARCGPADPKQYFAQPQVWADIESVYRSFLEVFPDSPKAAWHRSKLAKWAVDCGQWEAAHKVFAEIGDSPDLTVFRSMAVYNYYRKKAERKSGRVQQASAESRS